MGGLVARRNRFSQRRLSGPSSQLTRPNKSVRLPSTGFTILPFVSPLPPGPSGLTAPYQLPHLPVLLLLTPVPMSPLSALTFPIRMRPYLIYPLTILNQFYHFNIVKHILHFIALGLAPFNNSYLTSALAVLTFVYFTIL